MSGSGRLRWIRRRRGTIACVAVLALIAIGYITFSFVHVDNGNTQQCVNTRTMKVADDSDCETGTGTGGSTSGNGTTGSSSAAVDPATTTRA